MIVQLRPQPHQCPRQAQAGQLGAFEWPSLPSLSSLQLPNLDWKLIALGAVALFILWKGIGLGSSALADRRKRRRTQLERREQLRHDSAVNDIARRYA